MPAGQGAHVYASSPEGRVKTMAADRALQVLVSTLRRLGELGDDAVICEAARRIDRRRRMMLGGLLDERSAAGLVAAVVSEGLPAEDDA